jgi:hypothetical protein
MEDTYLKRLRVAQRLLRSAATSNYLLDTLASLRCSCTRETALERTVLIQGLLVGASMLQPKDGVHCVARFTPQPGVGEDQLESKEAWQCHAEQTEHKALLKVVSGSICLFWRPSCPQTGQPSSPNLPQSRAAETQMRILPLTYPTDS